MAWTSPKTFTSAVLSSAELNTHLRDQLLYLGGTDGMLNLTGTGPHVIGGAESTRFGLYVTGAYTASGGAGFDVATYFNQTLTVQANATAASVLVSGTLVEAGSGTHNIFASLYVAPPVITAGAAALTTASSLVISGVPTGGTNNFGLLFEAGGDDGIHIALSDGVDVAHGVTTLAPTSVYFLIRKASATEGGVSLQGYSEGVAGFKCHAIATSSDTTEAGGSNGAFQWIAEKTSGTGTTTFAADDNIVAIKNGANATHIFKGNGDSYEDGTGWTAYDDHDDIALIEALEYEITDQQGSPIRMQFANWMTGRRALLERLRLATFGEDGRIFVNRSGMQALICGFARQITRRVLDLEARVAVLEAARG
jgi:hypothetical protein